MSTLHSQLSPRRQANRTVHEDRLVDALTEQTRRDESQARALVQRVMHKALRYGLERKVDVRRLVDLTIELGTNFECEPEYRDIREALERPSLPGFAKMILVDRALSARLIAQG